MTLRQALEQTVDARKGHLAVQVDAQLRRLGERKLQSIDRDVLEVALGQVRPQQPRIDGNVRAEQNPRACRGVPGEAGRRLSWREDRRRRVAAATQAAQKRQDAELHRVATA